MISIDILPNQRDFANALGGEAANFRDDLINGAGDFRAARIGHNTKCAEFIAAFLDGHKGREAFDMARLWQLVELFLRIKFRLKLLAFMAGNARNHFRHFVIALRAKHHIHDGCAAHDFFALGLRDAARDGHGQLAAVFLFHFANTAQL